VEVKMDLWCTMHSTGGPYSLWEALGVVCHNAVMINNFVYHSCSPFPLKELVKSFFIFELWALCRLTEPNFAHLWWCIFQCLSIKTLMYTRVRFVYLFVSCLWKI